MATVSPFTSRIIRRTQLRSSSSTPPLPMSVPLREEIPAARVLAVKTPPTDSPAPPPAYPPPPAERLQVVDHPAAQHAFTVLRNRQTPHYQFRTTCSQLLVVLALEAMRSLETRLQKVDNTRVPWSGAMLAKPVVLLSVARDGLSLSQNLMECVPGLIVGSISLERATDTAAAQARLHLSSAPALSVSRVILFDPVVQTGNSAATALSLVRQLGANDVSLVSFTITTQGLHRLQAGNPGLNVWSSYVDTTWDPKRDQSGVLGDFGARLFA